jgi:hypothetical protein
VLAGLRDGSRAGSELAWAQTAETHSGLPASTAAGQPVPGLVFDLVASIVIYHSDKDQASKMWKETFGYHPLFCFLDNTREASSAETRPAAPTGSWPTYAACASTA